MQKPKIFDMFLYRHFKNNCHSTNKILIQPVGKMIYDPNSSSRLKNIKRHKLYDRSNKLYKAALLTRYYVQYFLSPYINSEFNHKRHFIKIPFINKGREFIDLHSIVIVWTFIMILLTFFPSFCLPACIRLYVCLSFCLSLSVCLAVYLFTCLCLSLSVCLSICSSIPVSVCPSIYLSLSVCLSICLSIPVSVCPSIYLSLSVCLSICLSIPVSVCPSIYLSLSVCLSACQYLSLSVHLFTCLCLSVCLSICLPIPVSVCPSIYLLCLYVCLSACLSACL